MVLIKIALILIFIIWAATYISSRYYKVEGRPDSVIFATTEDGWKIAISRYFAVPKKGRKKKRLPVVLCHGLSGNHVNWDISKRLSVARTIARSGYEVFSIDLRGAGYSEYPGWLSSKSWDWDFETYLNMDIPAALNKVLEVTGEKKVHYVAHSMGGMFAYAFLQTNLAKKIKSTTILASPTRFDQFRPLLKMSWWFRIKPVFYIGTLAKAAAFLGELSQTIQKYGGNLELSKGHVALAQANTVENVPSSLMSQFIGWVKEGKMFLSDEQNVMDGFPKIKTPTLFIVGSSDQTVIPASVREAYEAFGSSKKEFHILGPEHGNLAEYGHQSVQFGRFADREVYPLIVNWLEKN